MAAWGSSVPLSQPHQLNRWPSTAPNMGHSRNWVAHTWEFYWPLPTSMWQGKTVTYKGATGLRDSVWFAPFSGAVIRCQKRIKPDVSLCLAPIQSQPTFSFSDGLHLVSYQTLKVRLIENIYIHNITQVPLTDADSRKCSCWLRCRLTAHQVLTVFLRAFCH